MDRGLIIASAITLTDAHNLVCEIQSASISVENSSFTTVRNYQKLEEIATVGNIKNTSKTSLSRRGHWQNGSMVTWSTYIETWSVHAIMERQLRTCFVARKNMSASSIAKREGEIRICVL